MVNVGVGSFIFPMIIRVQYNVFNQVVSLKIKRTAYRALGNSGRAGAGTSLRASFDTASLRKAVVAVTSVGERCPSSRRKVASPCPTHTETSGTKPSLFIRNINTICLKVFHKADARVSNVIEVDTDLCFCIRNIHGNGSVLTLN